MYRTRLTPRQIDILIHLLGMSEYISSNSLAREFKVSIRTIKKEMSYIRDYLKEQGEKLNSIGGKGYFIEVCEKRKNELIQLLNCKERLLSPMNHQMRAKRMIIDLFLASKPLTINYFAENLEVNQNTIFNDFILLKKELEESNVFIKSNHYGYSLSGEEIAVRDVVSGLLQVELTNFDMTNLLCQLSGKKISATSSLFSQNKELEEIYQVVIRKVIENLDRLSEEVENYIILSLIIRLCLSIIRMKNGYILEASKEREREKSRLYQFLYQVYDYFDLPKVEAELHYILAQQEVLNQVDIPKFTEKVISEVSEKTNIRFSEDLQLFKNLYTHFSLRFSKGHIYLNEYNPFVNEIKQDKMFNEVQDCLSHTLPQIKLDDSFVAYVSLHFLASIERQKNQKRKISILYVCSTGVGVASFIQQKVAAEVKGVEIVGFASVLNCRRYIEQLKPDLVISVFPIEEVKVPVLEVKAFLSKNDLVKIQEQVNLLLSAGFGSSEETESEAEKQDGLSKKQAKDIIVLGYTIYEELKLLFKGQIKPDFQEGFLLHVLLMTRRIVLNQQYQDETQKKDITKKKEIQMLFDKYNLKINDAEIDALTEYLC